MSAWRGDPAAAIGAIERSLAIHRELGDHVFTVENLIGLAGLHLVSGDAQAGHRLLGEAVRVLTQSGGPLPLSQALLCRAVMAHQDGDHVRAARFLGAFARIKEEGGAMPPQIAFDLLGDPEASTRGALGDAEFEQAREEGYAMTPDQAWAEVLAEGTPPVLTERSR